LFGMDSTVAISENSAEERLQLYNKIKKYLPESSQKFWETDSSNKIKLGVGKIGKQDLAYTGIIKEFAKIQSEGADIYSKDTVKRLATIGIEDKKFRRVFGKEENMEFVLTRALLNSQHNFSSNYFAHLLLRGYYADESFNLPPCFCEVNKDRLANNIDILQFHLGDVFKIIPMLSHKFDVISLSNAGEWMSPNVFIHEKLPALIPCLNKGGCLLLRYGQNSGKIETTIKMLTEIGFTINYDINQQLQKIERGILWKEVIAAWIK